MIVRIDHAAFLRGFAEAGELCEIAGVGPVPVSAIRALLPDAFVAAVVTDGHDVQAVAHLGRRFTSLQETVIEFRQPVCAECGNRARLENDHVVPFVDSRQTSADDAQRLCDACHLEKTTAENRARHRAPGREPPDFIDLRDPQPEADPPGEVPSSGHAGGRPRPDKVDEMIRRARAATRASR